MCNNVLHRTQPQPSLLHGDLWSANCALGPDGPYIFDPACYWGDRECDLAMLPLHTGQPPQIYDGYQSVSPLPMDFLDRQPIYQLYTLLNRARLFGGQHLLMAQKSDGSAACGIATPPMPDKLRTLSGIFSLHKT
ncbi:Ribulosamine/erythrulosamine 3- kinase potentially involved in protein deglycation [Salmonella enterica subsp. arizonae]|uniref:Ribulosamine/erythrulosamine 3- kinase potentially involved in protein deglycation n=1 Tax=Salmonella enterica subsp. arizonae TaxID=59203 RepID=A0A2X4TCU3_SALER|nr:Ribulosamine/erythrulosamine 3- kinase potentially involved in protein deglycation [Salmonella enterica subsp. arizonae]